MNLNNTGNYINSTERAEDNQTRVLTTSLGTSTRLAGYPGRQRDIRKTLNHL